MSPPSSNDPRSPKGPSEWTRHGRTAMELDAVGPAEERRAAAFGNTPVVTQPFPSFADPRDNAPQPNCAPPRSRAEQLRGPTQPMPQARSDEAEIAAPPVAPPVAVARMHEIGQRAEPTPAPAPSSAPRDPFTRTAIAAGHRVPSPVPEARAPVPAYPSQAYEAPRSGMRTPATPQPVQSYPHQPYEDPRPGMRTPVTPQPVQSYPHQPYEDPRPGMRTPTARESEAPRQLPASPAAVARSESPRMPDQFAQTTCSDVHGLLGKHPVPLPELGGSAGSPVAWSRPLTDSGKPTPEAAPAARVERALPEPKREARERPPMDDDEVELHRVLSGGNIKKRIALSIAVVLVSGLLGLSVYIKRSRSAEAERALAAAPEAAASASDPAVNADAVGAPSQAAEEDEPPAVASQRTQPEQAEQPAVAEAGDPAARATDPAAHTTKGGVTASSAAALYINGQYKEALAEYQLLARAYPKQHVYTELARILRRKLIETCMRTQPNRREQCKTM